MYYPGDNRWSYYNIGRQKINHILNALKIAQLVEEERANLISIPIANLGVAYAQSQGAKNAKPEWFNPWGQILKEREIKKQYSDRLLSTLSQLINEKIIPSWVYSQLDPDLVMYLNQHKS